MRVPIRVAPFHSGAGHISLAARLRIGISMHVIGCSGIQRVGTGTACTRAAHAFAPCPIPGRSPRTYIKTCACAIAAGSITASICTIAARSSSTGCDSLSNSPGSDRPAATRAPRAITGHRTGSDTIGWRHTAAITTARATIAGTRPACNRTRTRVSAGAIRRRTVNRDPALIVVVIIGFPTFYDRLRNFNFGRRRVRLRVDSGGSDRNMSRDVLSSYYVGVRFLPLTNEIPKFLGRIERLLVAVSPTFRDDGSIRESKRRRGRIAGGGRSLCLRDGFCL